MKDESVDRVDGLDGGDGLDGEADVTGDDKSNSIIWCLARFIKR